MPTSTVTLTVANQSTTHKTSALKEFESSVTSITYPPVTPQFQSLDTMAYSHNEASMNDMSNASLSPSSMKEELIFSSNASSSNLMLGPLPNYWGDDSLTMPPLVEPNRATSYDESGPRTPSPAKRRLGGRVELRLRMKPFQGRVKYLFEKEETLFASSSTYNQHPVPQPALSYIDAPTTHYDCSSPPSTPRQQQREPLLTPVLMQRDESEFFTLSPRQKSDVPYLIGF